MKIKNIISKWPPGVSDGLTLPCSFCGKLPHVDYIVKDHIWNIVIPKKYRLVVVCIDCFLEMAKKYDIDVSTAFEKLQVVTGQGQTIIMSVKTVFYYKDLK